MRLALNVRQMKFGLIVAGITALIVVHVLLFWLKILQVQSSLSARDHAQAVAFVRRHIPPGSKVVAEPMYWFAIRQAGADMQYMDIYEETHLREKWQREVYQYEYLLVTDHLRWRKPEVVAYYMGQAVFDSLGRWEPAITSLNRRIASWQIGSVRLLSDNERTGYAATIYRRKKVWSFD